MQTNVRVLWDEYMGRRNEDKQDNRNLGRSGQKDWHRILGRNGADAVLEVSVRANQEIVEELKGDESVCQALLEIMEPEINKIVGEATERVRKETEEKVRKETEEKVRKETEKRQAFDTAKIMISSGKFSAGEIVEYIPGISIEEVQSLEKGSVRT